MIALNAAPSTYHDAGFCLIPCIDRQPACDWGKLYEDHLKNPQAWEDVVAFDVIYSPNGWLAFSDRFLVVDCDSEEATHRWLRLIANGIVPDTPVKVTGNRGIHFYYRNSSGIRPSKVYGDTDVISGKHGVMIAESWHPKKRGVYEASNLDFDAVPELSWTPEADGEKATTTHTTISSLDTARSKHEERDDRNRQAFWLAKGWVESGEADTEGKLYQMISQRDAQGWHDTGSNHGEPKGEAHNRTLARSVWDWYRQGGKASVRMRNRRRGVASGRIRRKKAEPARRRAIELHQEGYSLRQIAAKIGKSKSMVGMYIREWKGQCATPETPAIGSLGIPKVDASGTPSDDPYRELVRELGIRPQRKATYRGPGVIERDVMGMLEIAKELKAKGGNLARIVGPVIRLNNEILRRQRTWAKRRDWEAVKDLESWIITPEDILNQ